MWAVLILLLGRQIANGFDDFDFFFYQNDSIELKNIEIYAQIFFKYNILSKTGVKGSSDIFINKRDYTSHERPMINDVLSTINE